MAKWVFDQWDNVMEYPTLGIIAEPGDILDALMAPDARWSLNADQGAVETVYRYAVGGDPNYIEPTDGHVLTYSATENTYVPTAPESVGLPSVDAHVADKIDNPLSATSIALAATYVAGVVVSGAGIDDTGVADSTAAIQAKIDAAVALGANVVFPPGIYAHTGLSLNGAVGTQVVGQGGEHATGSATKGAVLVYTGTGTGTAVDMQGSNGLTVRDLSITYTSASFTGRLIDLRLARYFQFDRCQLGGKSAVETATTADLDGAIVGTWAGCKFAYHATAISGADSAGNNFSVGHKFIACEFVRGNLSHVRNGGEGWSFVACTAAPMTNGEAGFFGAHTGTHRPAGMAFMGCWFGDVTAGTRAQIEVNGDGFLIAGGVLGIGPGHAVEFVTNGVQGFVAQGFKAQGSGTGYVYKFGTTVSHGPMTLGPLKYAGILAVFDGVPPDGSTYYDSAGLNQRHPKMVAGPSGDWLEFFQNNGTTKRWAVGSNGELKWFNSAGTDDTGAHLLRWDVGVLRATGKLTAATGIGVGNSVAATTPGSVVRKMEVFDAAGASLGFVPIYSTIT